LVRTIRKSIADPAFGVTLARIITIQHEAIGALAGRQAITITLVTVEGVAVEVEAPAAIVTVAITDPAFIAIGAVALTIFQNTSAGIAFAVAAIVIIAGEIGAVLLVFTIRESVANPALRHTITVT